MPRLKHVLAILPRLAGICALLALGAFAGPRLAQADDAAPSEYHLGIGDRLHIRTFNREDLSGDFDVRPPGTISFPLIGVIEVLGLTPTELERKVGEQLANGYQITSSVNVEISVYRPFYIMGDVLNAGKYPFAPGLNVLQAVALAGGYYAAHPSEAQIDAIHADESYNVYSIQERTALVRHARLIAERDQRPDMALPEELLAIQDQPDIKAAVATERQLFTARKDQLAAEISMREAQVSSYNEEINALNASVASSNEQQRLVNQELQDAQHLLEKGLTQRPRVLELQRVLAELGGEEAQSRAYLARARQNIGKIEQEIAEHKAQFQEDVQQQLVDTEAQLRELAQHRLSSRDLVVATERRIPLEQGPLAYDERTKFRIRRVTGDGVAEIDATETTSVQPDDVIVVPALMPQTLTPGQAALAEPQPALPTQ
ncbi:MAG TPA: polysaccharide biosynthesis/export family protein [Candidatus Cybelea sp.]|nr:polysaccharide biosynthesis/export family protein [Candidatus Cybelea sp.]